jgi:murein L,D-transpeptidase YafK
MNLFRFLSPVFFMLGIACSVSFFSPSVKKAHRSNLNHADSGHYTIVVDKSDYELQVFDEDGWYATYPVVFGSKDLGDKMREGDKRTPNGAYKVVLKKIHKKWGPELLLNYPTPANQAMFKERKAKGLLPANARIGDGIAIHGTRPDEEWTVDAEYSWTDGCISLKYSEMQDLFSYIPAGTPVSIRP